MKLENIVFAVAAKIDVDRSFVFEYVVCRHIQAILLKHTDLPRLVVFLADMVRASEISEAAMARWQLPIAV